MDTPDQDDDHNEKVKRDGWYKLRSIGSVSTAIVVALITVFGSTFLSKQNELSSRKHIYTQLLSEQQKSENSIRQGMFEMILKSFLDGKENNNGEDANEEDNKHGECAEDKIRRQLTLLEMITRNFHETMDLKPLFSHLLLSIIRMPGINYGDLDTLTVCQEKGIRRLLKKYPSKEDITPEILKDHLRKKKKKYLKKLKDVAKRITRKQLESLSAVEQRIRLKIDLTQTCKDIRPSCDLTDSKCFKGGLKHNVELRLHDNKDPSKRSSREFIIYLNRSYSDWDQVFVEVHTKKKPDEIEADQNGEDHFISKFWLSYFDFPLIDNTFISPKERFAVILDDMDEDMAEISLLYFPASYAGFKEKSYYQNRIINTLLSEDSASP